MLELSADDDLFSFKHKTVEELLEIARNGYSAHYFDEQITDQNTEDGNYE